MLLLVTWNYLALLRHPAISLTLCFPRQENNAVNVTGDHCYVNPSVLQTVCVTLWSTQYAASCLPAVGEEGKLA
jgi:hypothetical protein